MPSQTAVRLLQLLYALVVNVFLLILRSAPADAPLPKLLEHVSVLLAKETAAAVPVKKKKKKRHTSERRKNKRLNKEQSTRPKAEGRSP